MHRLTSEFGPRVAVDVSFYSTMCSTNNISAIGPFRVDFCDCGSLHVYLGPAMIRLEPSSLKQLIEVLEIAQKRLPVIQRAKASSSEDFRNN